MPSFPNHGTLGAGAARNPIFRGGTQTSAAGAYLTRRHETRKNSPQNPKNATSQQAGLYGFRARKLTVCGAVFSVKFRVFRGCKFCDLSHRRQLVARSFFLTTDCTDFHGKENDGIKRVRKSTKFGHSNTKEKPPLCSLWLCVRAAYFSLSSYLALFFSHHFLQISTSASV